MEPFSTRTTSSVTGGSTLTALRLRDSTASTTSSQLSVRPHQPQVLREAMPLHPDAAPIGGYNAPVGV